MLTLIDGDSLTTAQDIVELTKAHRSLEFPHGTRRLYSNTGYTLFLDDHQSIVPCLAVFYECSSNGEWERIRLSYLNAGVTSLSTIRG